jgi:hypothetical protein
MEEATLRLEGFSESLRGKRAYFVAKDRKHGEQILKGRLAILDTEVAHRGRKILVFQGPQAVPKWLTQLGWDTVFHARDVLDLKLIIPYLQSVTKPARLVWAGVDPAPSVLAYLVRIEGLTLLALGEKPPAGPEWQAIFWSSDAQQGDVEAVVQQRRGPKGTMGLRSVMKELQGSQVGLVWSSIEEAEKTGSLYWYDPVEGVDTKAALDLEEAAHVLTELASFLVNK